MPRTIVPEKRTPTCILCSSSRIESLYAVGASKLVADWRNRYGIDIRKELAGRHEVELYRCEDCDLLFFDPELSGSARLYEELERFDWYYMADKWEHGAALKDIRKGDKVLEIGCGVGDFVERVARDLMAEACGIELSAAAVGRACKMGRPVYGISLSEMVRDAAGRFDVVCSFQVLEHVPRPRGFLESAAQLVRSGGKLILGVPNADSYLRYQYNLFDMPPHHVTRWTRKCLGRVAGLLPVTVTRLRNEPLARYHADEYLDVHVDRARQRRFGRLVLRPGVVRPLRRVLRDTPVRWLTRGHTTYVCYAVN